MQIKTKMKRKKQSERKKMEKRRNMKQSPAIIESFVERNLAHKRDGERNQRIHMYNNFISFSKPRFIKLIAEMICRRCRADTH